MCRVTGKHSSPCEEQRLNGTDIIEIVSDPGTDNMIICDCVGILKERFSDVEQRFPKYKNWKNSKKKSTKCRMVFRTSIENAAGETEGGWGMEIFRTISLTENYNIYFSIGRRSSTLSVLMGT